MDMSDEISEIRPHERNILILDEDPDSLEILAEPLRWEGYSLKTFTSLDDAVEALEHWTPHLIISDYNLNAFSGAEIISKIREKCPFVGCLFVSANSATEAIISGLDAGADDYIVKPFVPLELLARVRTHLRVRDLHEQLLLANNRLTELVDTDDLTGLFNMRSLYQKLDFEMERAKRFNRELCVIMLDVDNFKEVNDGHDHLFGSFVLSEIGKIIKKSTRNIDIPARYGGDEFLIVLSEVGQDGTNLFCERLRETIAKTTFVNGKDSIQMTISIGFAIMLPGEHINSKELVRRADHALYAAKRGGKNQTISWRMSEARSGSKVEDFKALRKTGT